MKKKKLVSAGTVAIICIMVLIFNTIIASANPFKDVKEKDWFFDSVMYVNDNGLMKGVSDDEFAPQMTMSRAMIVTVLHRIEGEPSASPSAFKDVPESTWYSVPVAWASNNGVVNGFDEDTFGPNNDVTREQIATIMYRYAGNSGYDVSPQADLSGFNDFRKISDWSKDALSWANAVGLIKGRDGNMLAPGEKATRAEVATIFQRFCEDLEGLPIPDDPTEADEYYWENSEKVLSVENVEESEDVLTEKEAVSLLANRGFGDSEITYDYTIDGEYSSDIEASDTSLIKHPMYHTFYVTEEGNAWSISIVGNSVFASPIFYNLESELESELLISEAKTVTSYESETNEYYVTVPKKLGAIVKIVDRIDAKTLDGLTVKEIDKL